MLLPIKNWWSEWWAWKRFHQDLSQKMLQTYQIEDPWSLQEDRALILNWLSAIKFSSEFNTLLDLGCGEGYFLPFLTSLGQKVTALDISQEALSRAKEKNKNLSNIDYVLNSIHKFKFDDTYDFMNMIYVLDYLGYRQFTDRFIELLLKISNSLAKKNSYLFIANPVYRQEDMDRLNQFEFLFKQFGLILKKKEILQHSQYQIGLILLYRP